MPPPLTPVACGLRLRCLFVVARQAKQLQVRLLEVRAAILALNDMINDLPDFASMRVAYSATMSMAGAALCCRRLPLCRLVEVLSLLGRNTQCATRRLQP